MVSAFPCNNLFFGHSPFPCGCRFLFVPDSRSRIHRHCSTGTLWQTDWNFLAFPPFFKQNEGFDSKGLNEVRSYRRRLLGKQGWIPTCIKAPSVWRKGCHMKRSIGVEWASPVPPVGTEATATEVEGMQAIAPSHCLVLPIPKEVCGRPGHAAPNHGCR